MFRPAPRLVAVLGPTNTGKTHLAIERMLGHRSGMIGFPLRLLARENYDRIVRLRGARSVALITGEEKILPTNPSYFVCTVESMPLDRQVDFLAVDEIQLCADPERGHVFTARLLHARGMQETMFLGAATIKPLMRRLVPEVEYVSRPRFSTLSYTGYKKVTRLPPRSAVVAFAIADVFSLAELIRRQRGGTAVVLGALSPRARNAQVGMFQAGEVDYLVATDAIGMGLNMDLDHVAFARIGKFDGRGPRRLTAAEIAQIAGRAGRHMNDGTFGTTAEQGTLDAEIVEAIETHSFEPLTRLNWRNNRLQFGSIAALLKSLDERPSVPGLVQAREADDHRALQALARNHEIGELAAHPGAVRRGVDDGGHDGVDAHSLRLQLRAEHLGEAQHGRLGHSVRRRSVAADQRGARGDVVAAARHDHQVASRLRENMARTSSGVDAITVPPRKPPVTLTTLPTSPPSRSNRSHRSSTATGSRPSSRPRSSMRKPSPAPGSTTRAACM